MDSEHGHSVSDDSATTYEDDEEFCGKCYAGITSSEHHVKCVMPERLALERAPQPTDQEQDR